MAFVCGAGFVWTSPFLPKLNGDFDPDNNPLPRPTTPLEDSLITSLYLLGAVCSPLMTGPVAKKYGKKNTLLGFMVFPTISNVITAFANNVNYFYIARFLIGLGTGCVFTLIPIYVGEISDTVNRGATSIILILMVTLSQLIVYAFGPYMTIRFFALISLVPSVIFIICFGLFAPESSYHLILCNQKEEAEMVLKKLWGKSDVEKHIMEISMEIVETNKPFSYSNINTPKVKLCLVVTLGLLFFQQFSGILPIQCYLQTIFASADGFIPAEKSAMLAGAVSFLVTLASVKVVNLFGRKVLLLISYSGILVSLLMVGLYFYLKDNFYNIQSISWLPTLSVLAFLFFFCMGAGPLPWTLIGELFPTNVKSYLSSIAASFVFLLSFILTLVFPLISPLIGMAAIFWGFAAFALAGIVFIIYCVPETKGKTLLDIQIMLDNLTSK